MWKHPPGDEVYRKGAISVFEVDGKKNKVSCHVDSAPFDSVDSFDPGPVNALPWKPTSCSVWSASDLRRRTFILRLNNLTINIGLPSLACWISCTCFMLKTNYIPGLKTNIFYSAATSFSFAWGFCCSIAMTVTYHPSVWMGLI